MITLRMWFVLILIGAPAWAQEPIKLQAGQMSLLFEPENAFVRYIRVGDYKVLQGISAPVRDQFWGTVPPEVKNVRVEQEGGSFRLTFDVSCRQGEINFAWQGSISGSAAGELTFTFDGEARSDFLRNRIGFCVLHGPEAAGRPCTVESVDGQTLKGRFPEYISPHQPFKNIRTIAHEVTDGVWARIRMEGDTFEMEDQRNWTDASFKTYCTLLERPYPVRIVKGTRIAQRIEVSIAGLDKLPERPRDASGPVVLRVAADRTKRKPLPKIGLQLSDQADRLSESEISRLRALRLDHLRVDATPADGSAAGKLRRASDQARQLDVSLHVGLHLGKNAAAELETITDVLTDIEPPATWLLIAADEDQVRVAREFLKRVGQSGRLGRGEDTNFTELNRQRPDPATIDVVSFGINPQIHAFDNTSIVETLEIQGDTVRSARQFVGDRPLLITPITLKKQAMNEPPGAGELPANVDPRQTSHFAAGWTVGSLKYLAEAGVESATYYETVGWRGIMEAESGSPLPDRFPSKPGQLFPIYHVLRELAAFAGGHVRETSSADPMAVVGLVVEKGIERRLLVANLTAVKQRVRVDGWGDRSAVRRLAANGFVEEPNWEPVKADTGLPVTLSPHSIVVLDPR